MKPLPSTALLIAWKSTSSHIQTKLFTIHLPYFSILTTKERYNSTNMYPIMSQLVVVQSARSQASLTRSFTATGSDLSASKEIWKSFGWHASRWSFRWHVFCRLLFVSLILFVYLFLCFLSFICSMWYCCSCFSRYLSMLPQHMFVHFC